MNTQNGRQSTARLRYGGFSLTELLIVIAIVAVLIGLGLVAINSTRSRAGSLTCLNKLRQIALGIRMFADDHQSRFPSDDVEPWFIQIGSHGNFPLETFQCSAAPVGNPISYAWRDDRAVAAAARLGGNRIDRVASSELILVFDQAEGWHGPDIINAATIGGSTQTYLTDHFEDNLLLSVTTGQPFALED